DAEVIVLHVIQTNNPQEVEFLKSTSQRLLADIRYQFVTVTGSTPEEIIRIAKDYQVTDIVMGKRGHQSWDKILMGSVSQTVLESSSIPVIVINC
ncbi:MAG: universal stress protein, partial [Rivularia sp. (in: cyanobacteria)]